MSDKTPADYKQTVFLPQTSFPMRGGLPKKEPEILARWEKMDIYGQLREKRADAPKFVLHDGPPYANGPVHMGMYIKQSTLLKNSISNSYCFFTISF